MKHLSKKKALLVSIILVFCLTNIYACHSEKPGTLRVPLLCNDKSPSINISKTAKTILDNIDTITPYQTPDKKLFDYSLENKSINIIDVVKAGVDQAFDTLSQINGYVLNKEDVIVEIGGSVSYLRNDDGSIYWDGIGSIGEKPELDIFVYLPDEYFYKLPSYKTVNIVYHILSTVDRKFKESGSLFILDMHIKPKNALVTLISGDSIRKFLTRGVDFVFHPSAKMALGHMRKIISTIIFKRPGVFTFYPYLPNKSYFGRYETIEEIRRTVNSNLYSHRSLVLYKYYQVFRDIKMIYAHPRISTKFKLAKLLLELAVIRNDKDDIKNLTQLIKNYVQQNTDIGDLGSFIYNAEPGFLKSQIEQVVKTYYGTNPNNGIMKKRNIETNIPPPSTDI